MTTQLTPVILVVDEYWVLGKLLTAGQRVLDLISLTSTDYLTVQDAKVFHRQKLKTVLEELPEIVIPKEQLRLAVIPTNKFDPPKSKRLHSLVEKTRSDAFVTVGAYRVRGTLHITKHVHGMQYSLTNGLQQFFPVTAATVRGPGMEPVPASAVMVNKSFVTCFFCGMHGKASVDTKTFAAAEASG